MGYRTRLPDNLATPSGRPVEVLPFDKSADLPKPRAPRSIVHFTRPQPLTSWCAQCDQRVTAAQAKECASQWCKAK